MPTHPSMGDAPSAHAPGLAAVALQDLPGPVATRQRHALALQSVLPHGLSPGHQVDLLVDGAAACAAMQAAIDAARDHVNLEVTAWPSTGPANALLQQLAERRRQGVKVNLLIDADGVPEGQAELLESLREAGVQLAWRGAAQRSWSSRLQQARHWRHHRRLLVVDGRVAFGGGVNLSATAATRAAPGWRDAVGRMPWRDTHLRILGPAVARLQQGFIDRWVEATGRRPYLAHYFPRMPAHGDQQVGVAEPGLARPGACAPMERTLLAAIGCARQRLRLTADRFAPSRRLLGALGEAAMRGVDVQLIVPGHGESWASLQAGRARYDSLLRQGVRLHERCTPLLHVGTAVADGVWVAVGDGVLDRRGSRPDGGGVVLLDERIGEQLERLFDRDRLDCRELDPDAWPARGLGRRLSEAFARRFELCL